MKASHITLLAAAVLATASLAQAQTLRVYSEGVLPGEQTSGPDPATHLTQFNTLPDVPAAGLTSLLDGIVATTAPAPPGAQPVVNHNNTGPIEVDKFTDGVANADYPGQLPRDFPAATAFPFEPANTPSVDLIYDLSSATDIGSVIVYGYNYNNDTEGDCRASVNYTVQTTTDATVDENSAWTVVAYKVRAKGDALNTDYMTVSLADDGLVLDSTNNFRGVGVGLYNDDGSAIAAGVTGLRVQIFASGFGNQLRDPWRTDNTGSAVTSPIISEVVAYAPGDWTGPLTGAAADLTDPNSTLTDVNDWALY